MICPNQSNRGPLNKRKKKKLKCGSLPTADIVGAVGKIEEEISQRPVASIVFLNLLTLNFFYTVGEKGLGQIIL